MTKMHIESSLMIIHHSSHTDYIKKKKTNSFYSIQYSFILFIMLYRTCILRYINILLIEIICDVNFKF